jgi:hypothetical protein
MKPLKGIKFHVFPFPGRIEYYCGNEEAFRAYIWKCCEKEELPKGYLGWTINMEGGTQIIWTRSSDLGILVHEAFHATTNILNRMGHKVMDEPGAYLIEYIVMKCKGVKIS